jgi:hypothetical protein
MANTFIKIQRLTVGSGGAASIEFTSIPQTYTDLKILVSSRTNRADVKDYFTVRPNGAVINDSCITLSGDGTNASSDAEGEHIIVTTTGDTATTSIFGNGEVYIPNYRVSKFKPIHLDGVAENNSATESRIQLSSAVWNDNTAITSITLTPYIGSLFLEHTTATLYGIKSS